MVALHGGPGSGSTPGRRRLFDPDAYLIIHMERLCEQFLLFAVGALVPVLPFVWLDGQAGALVAAAGGLGLFALGAATTLFTGRGPLRSGVRQMLLGLAAAAVTYGVGALLGVAVA